MATMTAAQRRQFTDGVISSVATLLGGAALGVGLGSPEDAGFVLLPLGAVLVAAGFLWKWRSVRAHRRPDGAERTDGQLARAGEQAARARPLTPARPRRGAPHRRPRAAAAPSHYPARVRPRRGAQARLRGDR